MFKLPSPPPGCQDLDEHEAKLTAHAELLEERFRALLANTVEGQTIGLSIANQLAVSAGSYRRQAAALAKIRADYEHDRWLVSEAKKLRGNETAPRQRLRRVP